MKREQNETNLVYQSLLKVALNKVRGNRIQRFMRQPTHLATAVLLLSISNYFSRGIRCNVKTFWGGMMTVVLPEFMSNGIFRYGYCEIDMTVMLLEVLMPGMVFFDIGAHFGYATLLATTLVGDSGFIHSFEPTRSTFEVLNSNTVGKKNIRTINAAVYSSKQMLTFYDYGLKHSSLNSFFIPRMDTSSNEHLIQTAQQVQALTLDEYIKETGAIPNVVKIDAESSEYQILMGMQDTLMKYKPILIVEVGDFQVDELAKSKNLVKFLVERDYYIYVYKDGNLVRQTTETDYSPSNRLFIPK